MPLPPALRERSFVRDRPIASQALSLVDRLLVHARSQAISQDRAKAVHQLRLVLKALRALLRLFPCPGTGAAPEKLDDRLKSLGLELSPERDFDVLRATLLALVRKRGGPARHRAAHTWLQSLANPKSESGSAARETAVKILGRLGPSLRRHLQGAASASALGDGLRHSLRKCRRRHRRAAESCEPEAFHDWRRWQKRLETQLRWLGGGTGRFRQLLRKLHRLQEDLGRLHDLEILAQQLARPAVGKPTQAAPGALLTDLVASHSKRLQDRILCAARPLLRRRIPAAVRRIADSWNR